jgi:hypothetical protein
MAKTDATLEEAYLAYFSGKYKSIQVSCAKVPQGCLGCAEIRFFVDVKRSSIVPV